jgi:ribonuclease-3
MEPIDGLADLVGAVAGALGHAFSDAQLLRQALTHRSYSNEYPESDEPHNERLEFLGDAVVELSVSGQLMERLPEAREGDLTKLRAMVVSEGSLAICAAELGIGDYLRLGRGEDQSGGRQKPSILADAFEALMGAVFLDGGFAAADRTIRLLLGPLIDAAVEGGLEGDHKTRLQEIAQREWQQTPRYEVVAERGPDHAKLFTVAVYLENEEMARGEGPSKKTAEQHAARRALEKLR